MRVGAKQVKFIQNSANFQNKLKMPNKILSKLSLARHIKIFSVNKDKIIHIEFNMLVIPVIAGFLPILTLSNS